MLVLLYSLLALGLVRSIALPPPSARSIVLDALHACHWSDAALLARGPAALEHDVKVILKRQNLGDGVTTSGYAPQRVACQNGTEFVRLADGISYDESTWVESRLDPDRFFSYLSSINLTSANVHLNLSSTADSPVIGLAFSGGGYRAMVSGGGQLWATDPRNVEAVEAGIGGLLNVTTYVAGLSGGSWLLGSYFSYSNSSPPDLTALAVDWDLEENLVVPTEGPIDSLRYWTSLVDAVNAKAGAGYALQITDLWGNALGTHLFPERYTVTETPNLTMSDLSGLSGGGLPFPIIIAAEREPGELLIPSNATLWEFTPYEFGTWGFGGGVGNNESVAGGGFTPIRYLGTSLENGRPNATGGNQCVVGFDNLAWTVGTSSTLFNAGFSGDANDTDSILSQKVNSILASLSANEVDVSILPNPFVDWRTGSNPIANLTNITLVDAGETLNNIPFEPLLVRQRKVDVILAFDNSADIGNWPNGTAPSTTAQRFNALSSQLSQPPFLPPMPQDPNTYVNTGLNTHPTFFGCSTDQRGNEPYPLVVYVPNYPWSAQSNVSTFQLQWEQEQVDAVLWNGVRTLTLNHTIANWSTCLACALVDRAVARQGNVRSEICRDCFSTWCWDGTIDDSTPSINYTPTVGTVPPFLASLGAQARQAEAESSAGLPTLSIWRVWGALFGVLALTVVLGL